MGKTVDISMETETESGVDSIQALLLSNPALKRINEKRILCSFTKHEIPCTEKAILQQSGETFVPTPMQNRNKRNEKNDKNEDESEMGDEEDGGPPGDDLSDLYPDMDFNKLTIQEEIVEKKVLSHLQQKKRKRRKRTSNRVVALGGTKKQQRKNMSAVVCRDEEVIPSKQMKVMQGAGGSELLVYN